MQRLMKKQKTEVEEVGLKEAKLPSVRMALMGHLYQPTPPLRRHSGRREKTNIRTKGCGYADQK